jgi:Cu/Ag efflux pump CusA
MVRSLGYIKSLQDLENIVVSVDAMGTPVLLNPSSTKL